MSKTSRPSIIACIMLLFVLTACGAPSTQTPIPDTETPMPTARPTETATLVPLPTETVVAFSPTPELAPICQPGAVSTLIPAQCQLPIAEQSSTFCSNKNPYNLILINEGATYEVSGERIHCSDQGMKEGKKIVACTGPISESFEMRVCDPVCAPVPLQSALTHCPQNYNFDATLGCCSQEPQQTGQDCVVLKLQTTSCVVNCAEFTKQTACERNSFACFWDSSTNACQSR